MTRVRRRTGAARRDLTADERLYLMHGHRVAGTFEAADGTPDDAAIRDAWTRHRDDLEDRCAADGLGLRPWAAVFLDGARGHTSAYCHLGAPTCHLPAMDRRPPVHATSSS